MVVQELHPQSTEDGIVVDGVSSVAKVGNRQTASASVTEDDKRPSFSEQKNSQTVSTYGTEDDKTPSISDQKNGQSVSTTGTEDHKKLSDSEYEIGRAFSTSCDGVESNRASEICRVCQCDEPDRRGDAALVFLGISPPVDFDLLATRGNGFCGEDAVITTETIDRSMMCEKEHGFIKFVSPDGEVFTCNENEDLEAGRSLCFGGGRGTSFYSLTKNQVWAARYWAILFVFWFLVFAVWASRNRTLHNT